MVGLEDFNLWLIAQSLPNIFLEVIYLICLLVGISYDEYTGWRWIANLGFFLIPNYVDLPSIYGTLDIALFYNHRDPNSGLWLAEAMLARLIYKKIIGWR